MTPSLVPALAGRVRGQSSVIGLILIFGMVLTATVMIVVLGAGAISDSQEQATQERTEKALTQFDSRAALVALGASDVQQVSFGADRTGNYEVHEGAGRIQVNITNQSSGTTETLVDESLGAITTESGDNTLAYQGGGVWRKSSDNNQSIMVSPPEYHYRNGTLTLPVLTLTGGGTLGSTASIKHENTTQEYPDPSDDNLNPVTGDKVTVTIQSDYYIGWGNYFETRTDGGVSYDHSANEVTVTLLRESSQTINHAVTVTGGSGTLVIQAGKKSVIDSYDSSSLSPTRGPNNSPSTYGDNGSVMTTLDVDFNGNARVRGSLETSGEVTKLKGHKGKGSPYQITGNLQYGEGSLPNPNTCSDHVKGWCAKNATVDDLDSMDDHIRDTISSLSSSNDNGDEPCFNKNNGLLWGNPGCSSPITLEAGDYYTTNNLQVGGNKLLLDTSNGNIRIAVDNNQSIQIQSGSNVTILGDGQAKFYDEEQIQIQNTNTIVWNRGWDATQMWLYCTADCQIQIQSGKPKFVGAIYAAHDPSNPDDGQVQIQNQAKIWGGIVATGDGGAEIKNKADVHFDQSLANTKVTNAATVPDVTYLHVSVNNISVS